MTTGLSVACEDGLVGVLTIQRAPNNFFDLALVQAIADAAHSLAQANTRAIVLRSEGKHFCAGADFTGAATVEERMETTRQVYAEAVRLFDVPVPIVAAVQGSAVGGGLGLACAADFRVAAPSSRFHANFSHLGIHQGFGLSESLPQIVGHQNALRLLCLGERVSGDEARQLGLVDVLVGDDELQPAAMRLAQSLSAAAPLAVRSIKQTLRGDLANRVRAIVEREVAEQGRLWATEDFEIGLAANLARQVPAFRGR